MREIQIHGKAQDFANSNNAIQAAQENARYLLTSKLEENEVVIERSDETHSEGDGKYGTCKASFLVGTMDEKIKYYKMVTEIQLEEAKRMDFKQSLKLDNPTDALFLKLTEKHGIDKMKNLLKDYRDTFKQNTLIQREL